MFFGQIWSQNFKSFKFSEILYKGILLHAYTDFNVYVCQSYFLGKFGLKH